MFITAKAYFDDNTAHNNRLLTRMETDIPETFVKIYRKNVAKITPMKTGALRRSIITQVTAGRGDIGWRSRYAAAQNAGGHSQSHTVRGRNQRDGGFGTIKPDVYRYTRYTTERTGPKFASRAFKQTKSEMPPYLRERGYIK